MTSFKTLIRGGQPAVGTMVTLNSPEAVEALSLCGFDWLFIDMEHGALDVTAAQALVRAADGACLSMVRVPENSPLWIRRVLDLGCDGIVVPLVCSAADARRAIDAARYPPAGQRSVGIGRAHRYGLEFASYVAEANDRVTVIIQIEHIAAVEALDEILAVQGIDGILIGPYDLSGSMNRLGQVSDPAVKAAISRVREACAARGMPHGIFVLNPDAAPAEIDAGASFIITGTDAFFLTGGAKKALDTARGAEATS